MVVRQLRVGMGGGTVWGDVEICTGEQLSGKGVPRRARGTVFRVVSVLVGMLFCGSGLRLESV